MADILTGADAISGSRLSYQEANKIKNCYRGAAAPADAVAGVLWQDSADDRLYQYDGAAWNLLGPDEVGTWTPAITFGGLAVGVTYGATNAGRYVRMGNWVTITGRLVLTSKGASNGDALITGLPFTCKNDNGSYAAANVRLFNITFADQWTAYVNINTKTIPLNEVTAAGGVLTTLTDANFADNSEVVIGATYEIEV